MLRKSEAESKFFNLEIARGFDFIDKFDPDELSDKIIDNNFDICRIKVNGNNPQLFESLEKLGMPYYMYAINFRNEKTTSQNPQYSGNEVTFEEYRPSNENRLKDMLKEILNTKYWFEYDSPLSRLFLPENLKLDLAIDYYSSFYPDRNKNGRTWFLKHDNNYVGIFMGYVNGQNFEGIFYGILPKYRSLGLSKRIYEAMDWLCHKNNWNRFFNDVNIFNAVSQSSAMKSMLKSTGIYFNVIIYSLFSKSIEPACKLEFNNDIMSFNFAEAIFNWIKENWPGFDIVKFTHRRMPAKYDVINNVSLILTFPYTDSNKKIMLARLYGPKQNLLNYGYVFCEKQYI